MSISDCVDPYWFRQKIIQLYKFYKIVLKRKYLVSQYCKQPNNKYKIFLSSLISNNLEIEKLINNQICNNLTTLLCTELDSLMVDYCYSFNNDWEFQDVIKKFRNPDDEVMEFLLQFIIN